MKLWAYTPAKLSHHFDISDDKSGIVVLGKEWAFLALTKTIDGVELGMFEGT
ncbi:hypothetical protein JW960_27035 [candidate division KSB1 bacterium]|nr:hypothetical protein [candidate division KSB1 bacterium]